MSDSKLEQLPGVAGDIHVGADTTEGCVVVVIHLKGNDYLGGLRFKLTAQSASVIATRLQHAIVALDDAKRDAQEAEEWDRLRQEIDPLGQG